jgi:hypothetical protein
MNDLMVTAFQRDGAVCGAVLRPAAQRGRTELPGKFIEWQIRSREALYEALRRGEAVRFLASHLPVLATLRPQGTVNLATKGVGLVPKREHIARYIQLLARALRESHIQPGEAALALRIEAARELLQHPDHIDPCSLGSLEIFEGETFRNVRGDPRVALLFTGDGPEYPSFQVEAVAQIVEPGRPVYEFLRASRLLFEHERFHIAQPAYPHAYRFLVSEVREKTPHRRDGVRHSLTQINLPCPAGGTSLNFHGALFS